MPIDAARELQLEQHGPGDGRCQLALADQFVNNNRSRTQAFCDGPAGGLELARAGLGNGLAVKSDPSAGRLKSSFNTKLTGLAVVTEFASRNN